MSDFCKFEDPKSIREPEEIAVGGNNLRYEPGNINVNRGAEHSCYNAIAAVVNPGDEVIIPAPHWTSYPEMVRLVGGIPVIVETKQENGWKITAEEFEDAMSPMTKMIIINFPGNPTGSVYTKEEIRAIADIAAGNDVLLLSDEIYEKLVYSGQQKVGIASLSEDIFNHTIAENRFSKASDCVDQREESLDYLEQQIPSLSAAAVDVAYWQALAAGQAVLISGEGGIYQAFSDGTKKLIKKTEDPLSVPVGTRVRIP